MHILTGPGSAQLEVKKSRFLASAAHLPDPAAAGTLITRLSDPDARHNCWAWRHGQHYRFHDAGEPGGTAGKPILAAIDGELIDQVVVVVTRHFGGIKLGTGGLVRAYGKVAAAALRAAPGEPLRARGQVRIRIPIARRSQVMHALPAVEGVIVDQSVDIVHALLNLSVPLEHLQRSRELITNLCAGQVEFLAG